MVRGIKAKKIMGLKETKLLKLGDSCRRRDGTGFIMASHMQQVPSFWDKIPFNFFFHRSSFFLISLTQGTNLHYFFTLKCLSSLFLVTLPLLLQPSHTIFITYKQLWGHPWWYDSFYCSIFYSFTAVVVAATATAFVVVVVDDGLVAVVDAVIGKYHFLAVPLQRLFVYYYYYFFLTISLRLFYVPSFSKTCWFQAQEM